MAANRRAPDDFGFNGFFNVRDPHALFNKLRYDYGRMVGEPLNAFPAWDFFVTAHHLVDWGWPSAKPEEQNAIRREDAILRICQHLANGAKHFLLKRKHASVAQLESFLAPRFDVDELLAIDPDELALGSLEPDDGLYITLESTEVAELGVEVITAPELARRVLIYWAHRMDYGDISDTLPRAPSF